MNPYLFLNANDGARVDESGRRNQEPCFLAYGDRPEIVFALLDDDAQKLPLASAASWQFALDVDRKSATTPLCRTLPADITYNAASKTLSFPIDAGTAEFLAAVDGENKLPLIAELYGFDASGSRIYRFTWQMFGIMPVDGAGSGTPSEVPDAYVTKAEFAARQGLQMLCLEKTSVAVSSGAAAVAFLPHVGEYDIDLADGAALEIVPDVSALDMTKSYYFDIKIASSRSAGFSLALPLGWTLDGAAATPATSGNYTLTVYFDAGSRLWYCNLVKLEEVASAIDISSGSVELDYPLGIPFAVEGGTLSVLSGGEIPALTLSTLNASGIVSGGIVSSAFSDDANMTVMDGGKVYNYSDAQGAVLDISSGGVVSGGTISADYTTVYSGGVAYSLTIEGHLTVLSGGAAYDITGDEERITVSSGGTITYHEAQE